jgi:hypothetical protein
MKIGFLLNVTFLLCFIVTQLLIWLLDGTLIRTMAELLNIRPFASIFERNSLKSLSNQTVASIYHNLTGWREEIHKKTNIINNTDIQTALSLVYFILM